MGQSNISKNLIKILMHNLINLNLYQLDNHH
jgi:hypothetical protein